MHRNRVVHFLLDEHSLGLCVGTSPNNNTDFENVRTNLTILSCVSIHLEVVEEGKGKGGEIASR